MEQSEGLKRRFTNAWLLTPPNSEMLCQYPAIHHLSRCINSSGVVVYVFLISKLGHSLVMGLKAVERFINSMRVAS